MLLVLLPGFGQRLVAAGEKATNEAERVRPPSRGAPLLSFLGLGNKK